MEKRYGTAVDPMVFIFAWPEPFRPRRRAEDALTKPLILHDFWLFPQMHRGQATRNYVINSDQSATTIADASV